MASSYYSADLTGIGAAGQGLQGVSTTVSSGSQFPSAAGAEDYPELTSAVEDFRGQWENAVNHLSNAIGALGQTTTKVGQFMAAHDQALADAWSGKTSGSSGR